MPWELIVATCALVVALIAVGVAIWVARRLRHVQAARPPLVPAARDIEAPAPAGPPAFVINPIKVTNPEAVRAAARVISAELDLGEPLFYETTEQDPGIGQTEAALAAGASVVVAAGGDGTVRAVATALAGGDVPMALIPSGTGNLLARNLELPVDGLHSLIHTALSGQDTRIDLAWLTPRRLEPATEEPEPGAAAHPDRLADREEHLFLVMAGVGFDAAMVAGAGDEMKKRVGWIAYFVAGVQHLHGRKLRLTMRIGDGEATALRLRTLIFANCGRLPAGIVLLPDARLDDGMLDIAAIDTRGGLFGWASLFGTVILQGLGIRRRQATTTTGRIDFHRGRSVEVELEQAGPVQVDGDLLGEAIGLSARIEPGALLVRTRG